MKQSKIIKEHPCGCKNIKEFDSRGVLCDAFILPCCRHTTMPCLDLNCEYCKGKRHDTTKT